MIKDKTLMSIIMNCHNGEKYLYKSISSVISQSYKNWELIFWDNNSTDTSEKIVRKFNDSRIKIYKSNNFIKLYKARNLAIEKASGDFVSFLDTDDFWQHDKIEKQISFFLQNDDFEIVYSNYLILDEKKKRKYVRFDKKLPSGIIFNDLLKNYTVGLVTLCLNRKIFIDHSFNEDLDIIGDFELILKLCKKKKIGYIHDTLATYRLHEENLSKKKKFTHVNELEQWIKHNRDNLLEKSSIKYLIFHLLKLRIKSLLSFF